MKTVHAFLHRIFAQAVTVLDAVWEVINAVPAKLAEEFGEQRGRGDAIDIVVAENHETFLAAVASEQTVNRRFHARQ